jgi:hypothetical protein
LIEIANHPDKIFPLSFLVEYLCIKFKNPSYADEKEWRIVYSPIIHLGHLGNNIGFRESNNRIISFNIFTFKNITGTSIGCKRPEDEQIVILEMLLKYYKVIPNIHKSKLES